MTWEVLPWVEKPYGVSGSSRRGRPLCPIMSDAPVGPKDPCSALPEAPDRPGGVTSITWSRDGTYAVSGS